MAAWHARLRKEWTMRAYCSLLRGRALYVCCDGSLSHKAAHVRRSPPEYALFILNRHKIDNFVIYLNEISKLQDNDEFMFFSNKNGITYNWTLPLYIGVMLTRPLPPQMKFWHCGCLKRRIESGSRPKSQSKTLYRRDKNVTIDIYPFGHQTKVTSRLCTKGGQGRSGCGSRCCPVTATSCSSTSPRRRELSAGSSGSGWRTSSSSSKRWRKPIAQSS